MRNSIVICLAAMAVAACSDPASNNAVAANASSNASNGAAPATPANGAGTYGNATAPANSSGASSASSYTARGFEPGWALTIAGGQMLYQSQNGPNLTVPAPAPTTINNGFEFVTNQLTARFTNGSCTEASGQVDPYTVQVIVAGQTLDGCGL
jgi:uncharacterized membrane protein